MGLCQRFAVSEGGILSAKRPDSTQFPDGASLGVAGKRWLRLPPPFALLRSVALLGLLFLLAACETLSWYAQAVRGHWSLLRAREPISEALANPHLSAELKEHLRLAQEMTHFAEEQLGLDAQGNYESYVETGRDAVLWSIFAAPPYSTKLLRWCFPVAGCVNYRGYFSRSGVEAARHRLQERGLDVRISEVDAYSTLGWFKDPLLDTFLYRPAVDVAALIFHELAHARLYVPGDSEFNESYATAVEWEGLRLWLAGQEDCDRERVLETYLEERRTYRRFAEFMAQWRERLEERYQALASVPGVPEAERQRQRDQGFAMLRAAYERRRAELGGGRFDAVIGKLNNAYLGSVAVYWRWAPSFAALLAESGSLQAFHVAAEELAELPKAQRQQRLEALAESGLDFGDGMIPACASIETSE